MPLHFFKRILAVVRDPRTILLLLVLCASVRNSVFSQGGYTRPNTSYGTRMYRTAVDSTFSFPTGCGSPSLRGYDLKMANIYYDSCGTAMYVRNPKTNTWTELAAGGSTVYVDSIYLQGDSSLYYTKDGVDYLVANLKDAATGGNDSLRTTYIDSTGIDSYFVPIAFPDGYFHADTSLRWQPSTGALLVGRNGALVQLQVKGRITTSGAVDIGGGLTVRGASTTTDTTNYKPVVQNTITKEYRQMTSWPAVQTLESGNGITVDGNEVRLADTIRQTTEIKVAYDSGANNLQINGYRDGTNNRMGISIEPDYNRVSIGAYQPGGSSLIQVNTDGTVNLIGRPLNLYLDTMRLIQTGTSTAYAPLATDMSKYRVVMIDKTTGALVSVVKDSIGTSGTPFSSDSLAVRRVGPGNINHIVSFNTPSNGGTGSILSLDASKDSANIFIGNKSGEDNTSGFYNVGLGNGTLKNNTTGSSNTAFGASALAANTVSSENTAVGQSALQAFNGGSGATRNTAIGQSALSGNTSGTDNIGMGRGAGAGIIDQSYNIMIGNFGGGNGTNRIGIGFILSSIGSYSLIIDNGQGHSHSTGGSNTHVGYNSSGGGTGIEQSHFGLRAGSGVTGTGNTALGVNAIGSYPGSTVHSGTYNTAVGHNSGYNSGSNITGNYNAAFGNSVQWPSASGSNQLAIGGNGIRWVTRFTSGNFQLNTTGSNVSETSGAALHITGIGALLLPSNNVTQAGDITPVDGMIIYVTNTDATFTAVGFWGRENGTWIKL